MNPSDFGGEIESSRGHLEGRGCKLKTPERYLYALADSEVQARSTPIQCNVS